MITFFTIKTITKLFQFVKNCNVLLLFDKKARTAKVGGARLIILES